MATDPVQFAESPNPRPEFWLIVIGAALATGVILMSIYALVHRAAARRDHPAVGGHRSSDHDSNRFGPAPNDRDARPPASLPELQQQVNRLVQEDPAIASQVLKQWMNRAA